MSVAESPSSELGGGGKVISRKECGQAPLSTSSPGSPITFMVLTNDTGVTSQDLFKIVGIISSISLLENGTNFR